MVEHKPVSLNVHVLQSKYEGWNFNSGNYSFI